MSVLDECEYNSVNNNVNPTSIFSTSRRSIEHTCASMKVTEQETRMIATKFGDSNNQHIDDSDRMELIITLQNV